MLGCPIQKSPDQSSLAAPRGLSQPNTSFIASYSLADVEEASPSPPHPPTVNRAAVQESNRDNASTNSVLSLQRNTNHHNNVHTADTVPSKQGATSEFHVQRIMEMMRDLYSSDAKDTSSSVRGHEATSDVKNIPGDAQRSVAEAKSPAPRHYAYDDQKTDNKHSGEAKHDWEEKPYRQSSIESQIREALRDHSFERAARPPTDTSMPSPPRKPILETYTSPTRLKSKRYEGERSSEPQVSSTSNPVIASPKETRPSMSGTNHQTGGIGSPLREKLLERARRMEKEYSKENLHLKHKAESPTDNQDAFSVSSESTASDEPNERARTPPRASTSIHANNNRTGQAAVEFESKRQEEVKHQKSSPRGGSERKTLIETEAEPMERRKKKFTVAKSPKFSVMSFQRKRDETSTGQHQNFNEVDEYIKQQEQHLQRLKELSRPPVGVAAGVGGGGSSRRLSETERRGGGGGRGRGGNKRDSEIESEDHWRDKSAPPRKVSQTNYFGYQAPTASKRFDSAPKGKRY